MDTAKIKERNERDASLLRAVAALAIEEYQETLRKVIKKFGIEKTEQAYYKEGGRDPEVLVLLSNNAANKRWITTQLKSESDPEFGKKLVASMLVKITEEVNKQ